MLHKRLYDTNLAQASYLVGSPRTGEALVVDPNRDIGQYLAAAEAEGLRITHVTETHIQADYVSGCRELAHRTGARLYLSDEGDADWKYAFAGEFRAVLLKGRDSFRVGDVRIDVLHTPGHTPEHLCFLVTDTIATDRPMGVFTGDFLFVGDVGRPDLLERAANVAGSMEAGARTLFRSLQRFRSLPDYLQVWPGHGAGSACGKSLGAVPQSTLGYEKLANWAFGITDEDEFVRAALEGQPEPPKYFAEMKRVNKLGPRILGELPTPPRLAAAELLAAVDRGAMIVDARPAADFARGHVPGTINIPRTESFTTWAGWLIPYTADFYLILDAGWAARSREVAKELAMIGLDRLAGYFGPEAIDAWRQSGRALQTIRQISAAELAKQVGAGAATILDVRGRTEWDAGHVPGAKHIPVGYLPDRADELPRDEPLVVHCQHGNRSAIAASLLQARGFENVVDLTGGFAGWERGGGAVDRSR